MGVKGYPIMLNLYLTTKKTHFMPSDDAIEETLRYLKQLLIIGEYDEKSQSYAPGREVATLFSPEPWEELLPAELTFENFTVRALGPERFLPERQLAPAFSSTCRMCGDRLDDKSLDAALERLAYFPVDRFVYDCPSCRNVLELKDINFGQVTAVARFWLYIEGVATSRLNHPLLDHLARLLGFPLLVVPEHVEDEEGWF